MSAVTTAAGVQEPVSNEMIWFLEDRKLDTDIALRLGVHGTHERITFPFIKGGEVVNNKHRRLNEKNFSKMLVGKSVSGITMSSQTRRWRTSP